MTFLDNYDTTYSIKENEHEYEKDSKKRGYNQYREKRKNNLIQIILLNF